MGILNASITGMSLLTAQGYMDWHPAGASIRKAARDAAQLCKTRGLDLGDVATRYSLDTSPAHVNVLGCNNRDVLRRNLDTATSSDSAAQREMALEIQRSIFSGLDQTHWEGQEIAKMKEALENPSSAPSR
ncbi:hypothetical protein FHG87_017661 [Trinorchestia longiramus]|nr:hypothetical protein FHG87_017661 [Trinorchestia longiramus]